MTPRPAKHLFILLIGAFILQCGSSALRASAREASAGDMVQATAAVRSAALPCTILDARAVIPGGNGNSRSLAGDLPGISADNSGFSSGTGGTGGLGEDQSFGSSGQGGGSGFGKQTAGYNGLTEGQGAGSGEANAEANDAGGPEAEALAESASAKANILGYEVACSEGLGYVIMTKQGVINGTEAASKLPAFTCIQTQNSAQKYLACSLEANKDQSAGIKALIAKAGVNCTYAGARWIGANAANNYFEAACQGGDGYVLAATAPARLDQTVTASPCVSLDATSSISCKLTSSAPIIAALGAYALNSPAKCTMTDHRFFGTSNGGLLFETACSDGNSYLMQRGTTGSFNAESNCNTLPAGTCTLAKK